MKNIAIFVMTPYYKDKKTADNKHRYKFSENLYEECYHTNEVGLKYLMSKMAERNEKLDYAYAIASTTAAKTVEDFIELFKDYKYPLIKEENLYNSESTALVGYELENEGSLKGVFGNIKKLFQGLLTYLGEDKENVTIHVDITSGQRPASMLLLAVIQMLKFYGYKTGNVIYSNLVDKDNHKAVVEDASDLLEMYDLMSGTQAFISYGDVREIEEYFGSNKNISVKLESLLNRMQQLSAALKICVSYNDMIKVLDKLKVSLDKYEKYSESVVDMDDREKFFSTLVEKLKIEYEEILPKNNKTIDVVGLIRWCLKKDMLQQAMTLYTEWLPTYLVDNGYITVDEQIQNECKDINQKNKTPYKSWQMCFFRGYSIPKELVEKYEQSIAQEQKKIESINDFRELLRNCNKDIFSIDADKYKLCENIEEFLEGLKRLSLVGKYEKPGKFLEAVHKEKIWDTIHDILKGYKERNPKDKKCQGHNIDDFVMKLSNEHFGNKIVVYLLMNSNSVISRILKIRQNDDFAILLATGKIQLKENITLNDMIGLIENYRLIVGEYRNKTNHGKAIVGLNEIIHKNIKDSLDIVNR